ncbi:MAG: proliferating cell nuclear antigen (pcna) [Candidatus Odinarchaeia archaeon]
MFKLEFGDAKVWKSIVDALSSLVDEAVFLADPNGLKMRAMDPSHIAMVDFELPKDAFDLYECSDQTNLGINLAELSKIMKRASAGDKIELSLDEKTNRLNVTFKGKATRNFTLSLLDLSDETPPTPKIEFNVHAKIIADLVKQAIDDAAVVSDHMKFSAENDTLTLTASGDTGDVEIKLSKDSDAILEIEVKQPSYATYALDYLQDIIKASATSEIIELHFSTNMPIKLDFPLMEGGRISYYLAPRVEAE